MECATDYSTLSDRYSKIKSELDEAEKSLTKLLGCNRSRFSVSSPAYIKRPAVASEKIFPLHQVDTKRPKVRKSSESAEESSSEDECPSKKVALQSAVIAKADGARSRKEVICKQNSNINLQSRNRRILGMVQSTLQQFQVEAVKRQPQDLMRIKALQKVDAAEEEEKQLVMKQKTELVSKTKEKLLELKCIEKMMKITESYELWETNQKYLLNFNVTKTEPQICFLPAVHTTSSKKHLERSRVKIKENIGKHKATMEMELAKIKESFPLLSSIDNTEEKSGSPKDDSPQKVSEQITEVSVVKDAKLPEESLSLELSEDESDFLNEMLYS